MALFTQITVKIFKKILIKVKLSMKTEQIFKQVRKIKPTRLSVVEDQT